MLHFIAQDADILSKCWCIFNAVQVLLPWRWLAKYHWFLLPLSLPTIHLFWWVRDPEIRQLRPSGWNYSCLLPGAVSRQSTCTVLAMLTVDELWSRNYTRTSPIPLCWFFSLNFPGSARFSAFYFPGWKPLYFKWLLTRGKDLRYVGLSCNVLQSHQLFQGAVPSLSIGFVFLVSSWFLRSFSLNNFSFPEAFSLTSKLSLKFSMEISAFAKLSHLRKSIVNAVGNSPAH